MRVKAVVGVLLVLVLSSASAQEATLRVVCSSGGSFEVRSHGKLVSSMQPDFALVEGRWGIVGSPKGNALPVANAVQITCEREIRLCRETIAYLVTEHDKWRISGTEGLLSVNVEEYRVIEWTKTTILAVAQPRAADLEIRISLEHQNAERTYTETESRGAKGASSIPVRWRLE